MKLLLVVVLLALTYARVYGDDQQYCFSKDSERLQTRHFTSKTAYQIIKGTNMDRQYLVPGCEAKKVWIFHRHGTRLPTKNTINKVERLDEIRKSIPKVNSLCKTDYLGITFWKWNSSITPDKENYLTSQGYDDLRGTARTYQKYYPDVMTKNYNNTQYYFRHTDTQRTTESFKAFTDGLFGSDIPAVAAPIPEKDLLLRPYDYCQSWIDHDYSSPTSENYKFKHSALWNQTIEDISKRLGFSYTLESSDVELMYDICRYEQAWYVDRISFWCAAFLPEQVSVFEYEDDMKYYYKLGYGYDENERLNCRSVQDLLTHMKSNEPPNVVTYFAHSAGLQTILTAMGIDKDEKPLTADNYAEHLYRKWTISTIDPFASNLLAVKYRCENDVVDKDKVMFFLNQELIRLDWCQVGLCNLQDVLKRYETIYKADCDTYYCRSGANTVVGISLLATLLLTATHWLRF